MPAGLLLTFPGLPARRGAHCPLLCTPCPALVGRPPSPWPLGLKQSRRCPSPRASQAVIQFLGAASAWFPDFFDELPAALPEQLVEFMVDSASLNEPLALVEAKSDVLLVSRGGCAGGLSPRWLPAACSAQVGSSRLRAWVRPLASLGGPPASQQGCRAFLLSFRR